MPVVAEECDSLAWHAIVCAVGAAGIAVRASGEAETTSPPRRAASLDAEEACFHS